MSRNELEDQSVRKRIKKDLDATLLIEASAGTGKTTALVSRMIALIKSGKCRIDSMAAITFTKKAASELRSRFQIDLEKAVKEVVDAEERGRLKRGLLDINDCFIGTIHSFSGSLLRERPIEANVPIGFTEIDENQDDDLRSTCWKDFTDRLLAEKNDRLSQLKKIDISLPQLEDAYNKFCKYPDIEDWPVGNVQLKDIDKDRLARKVNEYMGRIETMTLPDNPGRDRLVPHYKDLLRLKNRSDFKDLIELMRFVDACKSVYTVQGVWANLDEDIIEPDRWGQFLKDMIFPAQEQWLQCRYKTIMPVLREARDYYEQQRRQSDWLNFNDLLLKAAELLKDKPHIRQYFKKRFTHLLVDEFQDTDPIQAKIMLYLTASDVNEQDWRQCRPVEGSLFVVGDPKQSIYRFRRADIITYNAVKTIIRGHGDVLNLTTNFRSSPELIEWFNGTFREEFSKMQKEDEKYSPAYEAFSPDPNYKKSGAGQVLKCTVTALEENINYIVSFIQEKIKDEGVRYSDFMVLTMTNKDLGTIASGLRDYAIPCNTKNSSELNMSQEYRLLQVLLKVVMEPENPVALVSLLRSPLLGFSDTSLYEYRKAVDRFNYYMPQEKMSFAGSQDFIDIFNKIRDYRKWMRSLPCVSALKKMIDDIDLMLPSVIQNKSRAISENFQKILELISRQQSSLWSVKELSAWLETQQKLDMPATAEGSDAVHLMNTHNAKGLEARFVFLADIKGLDPQRKPFEHIDRSADKDQGYLTATIPHGPYHRRAIAAPPGWETKQAEEIEFEKAEKIRLLYVAATRAKQMLLVTIRDNRNGRFNMWQVLGSHINDEMPEPSGLIKPGKDLEEEPIGSADVCKAKTKIEIKWKKSLKPTFSVSAAKDITVEKKHGVGKREHGDKWGTLIHSLLEIGMRNKNADLSLHAKTLIEDTPLSPESSDEAVDHVNRIMRSEIWGRAVNSEQCLTEAPYFIKMEHDGVETIINGVLDLAFKEAGGWIIVDYKADSIDKDQLKGQVENYTPQVQMYAEHWNEMTGENVLERGLYFTELDEYIKIP